MRDRRVLDSKIRIGFRSRYQFQEFPSSKARPTSLGVTHSLPVGPTFAKLDVLGDEKVQR